MLSTHSLLRLYRCALRDGTLAKLRAMCNSSSESQFVARFDDFSSAIAELERLAQLEGGLEGLEDLEKMNDFNEFIDGWDD